MGLRRNSGERKPPIVAATAAELLSVETASRRIWHVIHNAPATQRAEIFPGFSSSFYPENQLVQVHKRLRHTAGNAYAVYRCGDVWHAEVTRYRAGTELDPEGVVVGRTTYPLESGQSIIREAFIGRMFMERPQPDALVEVGVEGPMLKHQVTYLLDIMGSILPHPGVAA